ncbi:unnamed protein product [Amoebophrya sp. A25]|nr:unnamed protein product [Amoebophrya sp. A25]|eukprot:GSA25T00001156001.1
MSKRVDAVAGDGQEDKKKACPMSGKYGQCPVSGLLSSKPDAEAKSDPFAAGSKSLLSKSSAEPSNEGSLAWALCPIHWSKNTIYLVCIVYACAFVQGLFVARAFL